MNIKSPFRPLAGVWLSAIACQHRVHPFRPLAGVWLSAITCQHRTLLLTKNSHLINNILISTIFSVNNISTIFSVNNYVR